MSWACIIIEGGFESRQSEWIRTIFENCYAHADDNTYATMAMYVSKETAAPCVLYFTPMAARKFSAAVSRFSLRPCERPVSDAVELLVGEDFATFTEWCELTEDERALLRERAYRPEAA